MRHDWAAMGREDCLALLRRKRVLDLAGTTPDGAPFIRPLHHVLVDGGDAVVFHSAPEGEKIAAVGREVVCSAYEHIADTPSAFEGTGPACRATALYRSVQFRGVLETVADIGEIRRCLGELMLRHEPAATWTLPAEPRGVAILRVAIGRMTGKARLMQNRSDAERIAMTESLWDRGAPGDLEAIDAILAQNPATPTPPFLAAPEGCRLLCAPPPELGDAAAALLADRYWTGRDASEDLRRAHQRGPVWLAAVSRRTGDLVGTVRAGSDGLRQAWVLDLVVADRWRDRGLGTRLMRLLLDHPLVRRAGRIGLATRDAQAFYERFGFEEGGRTAAGGSVMYLHR